MDSLYIITPPSINLVIMQRVFPRIIGIIFKCGKYTGGYRLRKRNVADTISFNVFLRLFERDRHEPECDSMEERKMLGEEAEEVVLRRRRVGAHYHQFYLSLSALAQMEESGGLPILATIKGIGRWNLYFYSEVLISPGSTSSSLILHEVILTPVQSYFTSVRNIINHSNGKKRPFIDSQGHFLPCISHFYYIHTPSFTALRLVGPASLKD